jgi:hypothetical protein
VYLSCSSDNGFFIDCTLRAITNVNQRHNLQAFELVYPPRRIGGDLGKVLLNVLRIRDADLVIVDLTPKVSSSGDVTSYNSGTMLELGLLLDQENLKSTRGEIEPWGGRLPRPRAYMFCDGSFPRRDLTPILNEYSVTQYSRDTQGEGALLAELERILTERVNQVIGLQPTSSLNAGAFSTSGASTSLNH